MALLPSDPHRCGTPNYSDAGGFDGITSWRIKRTNFAYVSPLLHQLSTRGIACVVVGLVALFLAPLVLEPTLIPAGLMICCVMAGLMVGNLQKRL